MHIKDLILSIDIIYIYLILVAIFSLISVILYIVLVKLIERQFIDLE